LNIIEKSLGFKGLRHMEENIAASPHGVTNQKTNIDIFTKVRNSDLVH
jgi:hypothetical protein